MRAVIALRKKIQKKKNQKHTGAPGSFGCDCGRNCNLLDPGLPPQASLCFWCAAHWVTQATAPLTPPTPQPPSVDHVHDEPCKGQECPRSILSLGRQLSAQPRADWDWTWRLGWPVQLRAAILVLEFAGQAFFRRFGRFQSRARTRAWFELPPSHHPAIPQPTDQLHEHSPTSSLLRGRAAMTRHAPFARRVRPAALTRPPARRPGPGFVCRQCRAIQISASPTTDSRPAADAFGAHPGAPRDSAGR